MDSLFYGLLEGSGSQNPAQAPEPKQKVVIRHRKQITEELLRNRKNYDIVWDLEPLCIICGSMAHNKNYHHLLPPVSQ